jgi:hypothetical protein
VEGWDEVVEHLVRTTPLSEPVAQRLVEEVVEFFREPAEAFVRRRHGELKAQGLANPAIFARIAEELATRPVQAPTYSERQIRRLIYG